MYTKQTLFILFACFLSAICCTTEESRVPEIRELRFGIPSVFVAKTTVASYSADSIFLDVYVGALRVGGENLALEPYLTQQVFFPPPVMAARPKVTTMDVVPAQDLHVIQDYSTLFLTDLSTTFEDADYWNVRIQGIRKFLETTNSTENTYVAIGVFSAGSSLEYDSVQILGNPEKPFESGLTDNLISALSTGLITEPAPNCEIMDAMDVGSRFTLQQAPTSNRSLTFITSCFQETNALLTNRLIDSLISRKVKINIILINETVPPRIGEITQRTGGFVYVYKNNFENDIFFEGGMSILAGMDKLLTNTFSPYKLRVVLTRTPGMVPFTSGYNYRFQITSKLVSGDNMFSNILPIYFKLP